MCTSRDLGAPVIVGDIQLAGLQVRTYKCDERAVDLCHDFSEGNDETIHYSL